MNLAPKNVERSQISNESTGGTFSVRTNCAGQSLKYTSLNILVNYHLLFLVVSGWFLVFCFRPPVQRGAKVVCKVSYSVILFIQVFLFHFYCWHLSGHTGKAQKALVSGRTSRQCNKLLCLLHPQLGAIGLTLTLNYVLRYHVHVQQEQQYSSYLADETDCQGHCVYRIPFRYFSNIPWLPPPQHPQDPLLDIFST